MKEVRIKLVSPNPLVNYSITKPEEAVILMQQIIGEMANEYFAAVLLNSQNKPLDFIITGVGGIKEAILSPGNVLKAALLQNSTTVMLFHNHPSGNTEPSSSDISSTQKFLLAARLMDINLLDHVILSRSNYYSFAEHGLLQIKDSEYYNGLKEIKKMSAEEFNKKYSFLVSNKDEMIYGENNEIKHEQ